MPSNYDPLGADKTVDADIGDESYIVTDFNDSGATAVGPDFQNSDGSYRGARRVKGPREASMTIEIENAAQPTPEQFAEFEYRNFDWVIFQAPRAVSAAGAGTFALSLRCVNIPGQVQELALTAGGTGYTSGDLIFTGGGGTGAAGTFIAAAGVITSVTLTNPGRGYTSAPSVTAAAGSGATITATIAE